MDHHYIQNRVDCRPYIIETLKFLHDLQLTSINVDSVAPMLARPRYPNEVMFVIGGLISGSSTANIEAYDTKSDRWTRIYDEDPNGPRAYHGTAVMGHYIYILGGLNGLDYFSSCRKFDTETKIWQEIAPMNCKRYNIMIYYIRKGLPPVRKLLSYGKCHNIILCLSERLCRCYVSVAMLDGVIYAIGGFDGHQRLKSVEKYDFERNQWTMVSPMNAFRSDACATVLNGKCDIFIFS